ncbi:unnamed protein product [Lactuca saligna]|uniref:poly(A)-specific ribonuclease n=1 Tax=Lactuca saligna TaxID=75948 RepID=A0AA35VAX4_LACSI|nr:unnamed protein product [Lactuca saligna]
MSIDNLSSPTPPVLIRIVNADNLEHEFGLISSFIDKYCFVVLETEFSGVILPPAADNSGVGFRHQNSSELYYHLKKTVEAYKPIQVALTLVDANGNLPRVDTEENPSIWGFNFKDFDPARDLHAAEWIQSMEGKEVDFEKNRDYGIDSVKFAEKLMSSGLVCNTDVVTWVTFHSAYDFGYLLKMLTGLHGGLEQVAKTLKVEPAAGKVHLAGENSLLTWKVFQKIKDLCCGEIESFGGVIYGLETF